MFVLARKFMVSQTLRRWRDRGAAAVEFALIVPVLITLIFGSIEFGLYFQARTMVQNSAREGVRMASLVAGADGSVALQEVKDAALHALSNLPGIGASPTVNVTCAPAPCVIGSATRGSVATVTVTVQWNGVTGMFLKATPFTATSQMRIEG
jgi:Flp pilus assembly protein TadG